MSRRNSRWVSFHIHSVAIGMSLLTSACVPIITEYYRPTASTNTETVSEACTAIAPHDKLKFAAHGAAVLVSVEGRTMRLRLYVPEGVSVKFVHDRVLVNNGQERMELKIASFSYYDLVEEKAKTISINQLLTGANETFRSGQVGEKRFDALIKFTGASASVYEVELPYILVNGKQYQFPRMKFEKKSGFGIYPINC